MTNGRGEARRYKGILERKQAELLGLLRQREEIAIEKSADELEEVQRAVERDLAVRKLDLESNLLRQVRAALCRVAQGTFGVCVHCEEPISPRRLEAVPWSPFCIHCQEAADRNEQETLASIHSPFRLKKAA